MEETQETDCQPRQRWRIDTCATFGVATQEQFNRATGRSRLSEHSIGTARRDSTLQRRHVQVCSESAAHHSGRAAARPRASSGHLAAGSSGSASAKQGHAMAEAARERPGQHQHKGQGAHLSRTKQEAEDKVGPEPLGVLGSSALAVWHPAQKGPRHCEFQSSGVLTLTVETSGRPHAGIQGTAQKVTQMGFCNFLRLQFACKSLSSTNQLGVSHLHGSEGSAGRNPASTQSWSIFFGSELRTASSDNLESRGSELGPPPGRTDLARVRVGAFDFVQLLLLSPLLP